MTPEHACDQVYQAVRRRLIASMRDELRTPINHIIGYSEMLQEEAQDQGQNGLLPDLQRIQGASLRLLTLVNDYLDEGTTGVGEVSTGRLSHELRGTLNAIVGYSEMMQEEVEDRKGQDFVPDLQKISLAAKHLLALVNGSLAFSQIEALERVPERITSPTPEVGHQAIEAAGACGDREVAGLPAVRGKLLVVDDNEMNRDMLSRRLAREGHTVATAQNGGQALNMVRIDNFDLVLLDVMMADMDGYQVLQYL